MAISSKGPHFPQEIILMGVRWYLAYPLSARHGFVNLLRLTLSSDARIVYSALLCPLGSPDATGFCGKTLSH
jgi:transposase-like protein